jgi:hypothetical protein
LGHEHLAWAVMPLGDEDRTPGQALHVWPLEALNLPVSQRVQSPSASPKPDSHSSTQDPPSTSGPWSGSGSKPAAQAQAVRLARGPSRTCKLRCPRGP